jgi:hypothetical protein
VQVIVSKKSSSPITTSPNTSIAASPGNVPGPARLEAPTFAALARGRLRLRLGVLWLALAVLIAGGAYAAWSAHEGRTDGHNDLVLCWRFAALKNAREPGAERLLAPAPTVPPEAVTPEEADRIDAGAFLREGLLVLDVRPVSRDQSTRPFLLVTKGSASSAPLRVRAGDKVDRIQRMVVNPNVLVEVRDGRIYPIRAEPAN